MGLIAPVLLFVRGDEAELPRGKEIDAQVSQDVALNPDELRQHMAALEAAQAAARERTRTGKAMAHFYFHLAPSHQGRPEDHIVLVDGEKLVRLRQWHFFDAQIAPGHHVIAVNGHTLGLDAKADEQYYIGVVPGKASMWSLSAAWLPELRDQETGEDEIYPLWPADKKDVYASQR